MIFGRMWLFLIGLRVMLRLPSGAAELLPDLTCNTTRQPDGSFFYQLSRPPSSSSCSTCWEHENGTVITRDSNFDPKLVQNLTAEGVFLTACHGYLHYTKECDETFEEAHCRVNCSSLLNWSLSPTLHAVNSTMDPRKVGLVITVIIFFVAGVVSVVAVYPFFWRYFSKLRRGSYTPGSVQREGEMEMV